MRVHLRICGRWAALCCHAAWVAATWWHHKPESQWPSLPLFCLVSYTLSTSRQKTSPSSQSIKRSHLYWEKDAHVFLQEKGAEPVQSWAIRRAKGGWTLSSVWPLSEQEWLEPSSIQLLKLYFSLPFNPPFFPRDTQDLYKPHSRLTTCSHNRSKL